MSEITKHIEGINTFIKAQIEKLQRDMAVISKEQAIENAYKHGRCDVRKELLELWLSEPRVLPEEALLAFMVVIMKVEKNTQFVIEKYLERVDALIGAIQLKEV